MSTPGKGPAPANNVVEESPFKATLNVLIRRDATAITQSIAFATLKDVSSGLYPVPSHKNYFGDIKVSNLISDAGCKGHLIAISSDEMLQEIFEIMPASDFNFSLSPSVGTAGHAEVLHVASVDKQSVFSIKFGIDLFGDKSTATLKNLRFLLSSANAASIIADSTKRARFTATAVDKLVVYATRDVPTLPVSLIGNILADQFDEIRIDDVRFYVDFRKLLAEPGAMQDLPALAREMSEALRLDAESKAAMAAFAEYSFLEDVYAEYDL
eukprot:gene35511-43050_t